MTALLLITGVAADGKPTYPATIGIDAARAQLRELTAEALRTLEPLGSRAALLADLARFVAARDS